MKKINIIYWISTVLFALAMGMSGVMNLIVNADSIKLFDTLGYPHYIIPFLGLAKILGAIAIVVPGFPRLKEWAYAGLLFDLIGASYSVIAVEGFQPQTSGMLIFFGLFALSYIYHHKRMAAKETHSSVAMA
jgi:uncharacterized membrane protein YphA (DoxX/SURF4 family)